MRSVGAAVISAAIVLGLWGVYKAAQPPDIHGADGPCRPGVPPLNDK